MITSAGTVTPAAAGHRPGFEVYEAEFAAVLGDEARLELVAETGAHEGPVYVPDEDALYFTALPQAPGLPGGAPRAKIKRLALAGLRFPAGPETISAVPAPVHMPNGMTAGPHGGLIVCEQGTLTEPARISHVDPRTGQLRTVCDGWRGLRLNSPNDVAAAGDGSVWFTDPSYGHLQGFRPEPETGDYVYRCDPGSGRVSVVADCFDKPNGLAFSPDGRTLYVTDSGANQAPGSYHPARPHHVLAFGITADGRHLGPARLFAVTTPGFPDGITTDRDGRVYVSSFSGVLVYTAAGDLAGQIRLPGTVNFTFGGPGGRVLYITTDTAIWAAVLNTAGAGWPRPAPSRR